VLTGSTDITHDLREFRFRAEGRRISCPGSSRCSTCRGGVVPRLFPVQHAQRDGEWHFQIRRVPGGQGTRAVRPPAAGRRDRARRPYGVAYLRTGSPRDIVCVAGGSGLAPMISIARGAAEAGMLGTRRLHFFYGAREPRDVCGEPMLAALAASVSASPTARWSPPGRGGWAGATGFVHRLPQALPAPLAATSSTLPARRP
jgi:toluene monooxygenase electron transfer component